MSAHTDYINTLETDSDQRELYSGSKDGIVKVWKMKNKKIKCFAQLQSSPSSINTICCVDKQFGKMFAIGSADKSIKMWKFKDVAHDEGENYQSEDEDIDENMRTQNIDDDEVEREQQLFQSSQNKEE